MLGDLREDAKALGKEVNEVIAYRALEIAGTSNPMQCTFETANIKAWVGEESLGYSEW